LIIRKTLEPSSENAAVLVTPGSRVVFQSRAKQFEATCSVYSDVRNVTLPHWVRLSRDGNRFSAQHSSDGVNWQTMHDKNSDHVSSVEIPMDEMVHIGLAVTSNSPVRSAEVRVSNVTVTGDVSPNGPFAVSGDISLNPAASRKN